MLAAAIVCTHTMCTFYTSVITVMYKIVGFLELHVRRYEITRCTRVPGMHVIKVLYKKYEM